MFIAYGLEWDGTFKDPNRFKGVGGVYMVWCKKGEDWKVLDVGESGNVAERLANHDRALQWALHAAFAGGEVHLAAHYTLGADADGRRAIEHKLRELTCPPCGVR
ncbi:conserved hypothetical protein [Anaeromyxobacter dehalogenans 2CP-1]|uniref:GIY-YIG domain-containing protein n=1 Tax=Anaeromyxobacter dehalogenans (strain ATCC BAA-258 / DSM 21875 / 2CP-1) TaxID=455488 RepID=B8JFF2_ANAD2|nr:hypothetical protein [Anaeromyxobacter dehalogenans]ACL66329.1 conserved hypothetical protein [Anaeromyxobacter dehalogenans 2CP-1]